jgi:redox-sensing transcriptional repressor
LFRLAVDTDPQKVGKAIQGLVVAPAHRLAELAKQHDIHIGLIAVPVGSAQTACDQFIEAGVRAIVNFAPRRLEAPATAWVRSVDLAIELETLAFYLARTKG